MGKPTISASEMAQCIDHTLLKPEATQAAFDRLCSEAVQYGFKAVCVNSARVAYISQKISGSAVEVCAVVGFPLGATHSAAKAVEAQKAVHAVDDQQQIVQGAELAEVEIQDFRRHVDELAAHAVGPG